MQKGQVSRGGTHLQKGAAVAVGSNTTELLAAPLQAQQSWGEVLQRGLTRVVPLGQELQVPALAWNHWPVGQRHWKSVELPVPGKTPVEVALVRAGGNWRVLGPEESKRERAGAGGGQERRERGQAWVKWPGQGFQQPAAD